MGSLTNSRKINSTLADCLLITILWCSVAAAVNPLREFPLNDDWSYSRSVEHFLEEGSFRPTGFTTMPLLTQTFWGSLFCIPFGFSFSALRISVLFLGLVGVIGLYLLLRTVQAGRDVALFGALTLAFNPIYFALSYTFMTDVPFTALLVLGTLFLVRSLLHESICYWLLGIGTTVASTLSRQLGLAVPLAFCVAVVATRGLSVKTLFRAALPTALAAGALVGFRRTLQASGTLPALYDTRATALFRALELPGQAFVSALHNASVALLYLGLFLLPLVPFLGCRLDSSGPWVRRFVRASAVAFASGCAYVLISKARTMPLLRNILVPEGIGPTTLRDTYILGLPHMPPLPNPFWITITVTSLVAGTLLLVRLLAAGIEQWRIWCRTTVPDRPPRLAAAIFCLSGAVAYFLPLSPRPYFDRYLLPLLPLVVTVIILSNNRSTRRWRRQLTVISLSLLLAMAAFSGVATRDYLSWNQARWTALGILERQHVPPSEIDGGFEFNGWHLYSPDYKIKPNKSRWWVHNDTYLIAAGEVEGYEVVQRVSFRRLLTARQGSIYILRRGVN